MPADRQLQAVIEHNTAIRFLTYEEWSSLDQRYRDMVRRPPRRTRETVSTWSGPVSYEEYMNMNREVRALYRAFYPVPERPAPVPTPLRDGLLDDSVPPNRGSPDFAFYSRSSTTTGFRMPIPGQVQQLDSRQLSNFNGYFHKVRLPESSFNPTYESRGGKADPSGDGRTLRMIYLANNTGDWTQEFSDEMMGAGTAMEKLVRIMRIQLAQLNNVIGSNTGIGSYRTYLIADWEGDEERGEKTVTSTWQRSFSSVESRVIEGVNEMMLRYDFTRFRIKTIVTSFRILFHRNVIRTNEQEIANLEFADGFGFGREFRDIQNKFMLVSFRTIGQCVLHVFTFLHKFYEDVNTLEQLADTGGWVAIKNHVLRSTDRLIGRLESEFPNTPWRMRDREGHRFVLPEHIEEICSYLDCSLKLYNNLFEVVKVFGRNPRREWKAMVLQQHMVALVPINLLEQHTMLFKAMWLCTEETLNMSNVVSSIGDDIKKLEDSIEVEEKQTPWSGIRIDYSQAEDGSIEQQKAFDYVHQTWSIGAFDFETYKRSDGITTTYAAYFAYEIEDFITGEVKRIERGYYFDNCAPIMLQEIHDCFVPDDPNEVRNLCMYAHNAARFDSYIVFIDAVRDTSSIPWSIDSRHSTFVVQDQSLTCLEMRSKTHPNTRLRILDSCRQLQGGLKVLTHKSFKDIEHKKLRDAYAHRKVNEEWLSDSKNKQLVEKYVKHDTLGLLEVVKKYSKTTFDSTGVQLAQCMTAATLSKNYFLQNFYEPEKYALYNLPKWMDMFIREGYFGGRCECGVQGYVKGPIYGFDQTSMYPKMGTNLLPYGYAMDVSGVQLAAMIRARDFFGFVRVRCRTILFDKRPLHGYRALGKLCFPHFKEWVEITLFSEELYKGKELGIYEYQPIRGLAFSKGYPFKEFFLSGFNKKAQAKAAGDTALEQTYKMIINSGYGWTCIRTYGKKSYEVVPESSLQHVKYLVQGKLVDYSHFRDDLLLISCEKDLEISNYSVAVGAAITSYGRMALYEVISYVDLKGGTPLYWDTDSVFMTGYDPSKDREFIQKFGPDYDGSDFNTMGNELGYWKSEGNDLMKKAGLKSKQLEGFDEGIFLLPKLYIMRKHTSKGVFFKTAHKGFSKKRPFMAKTLEDGKIGLFSGKEGPDYTVLKAVWDQESKIFRCVKSKNEKIFNKAIVNEEYQELDDELRPRFDENENPIMRGPPLWEDYERMLTGIAVPRTFTSLTKPFRHAMAEFGDNMVLGISETSRNALAVNMDGTNRYTKGMVTRSGLIKPLIIPDDAPAVSSPAPCESIRADTLEQEIENLRLWVSRFVSPEIDLN